MGVEILCISLRARVVKVCVHQVKITKMAVTKERKVPGKKGYPDTSNLAALLCIQVFYLNKHLDFRL